MKRILLTSILLFAVAAASAQSQRWYKGNTHTHTTASDGDAPIGEVIGWYYDHGYDFVAITDHNITTVADSDLMPVTANNREFLIVSGNELTHYPHTSALGVVTPMTTDTLVNRSAHREEIWKGMQHDTAKYIRSVQQIQIDGINANGGLPIVNHPNFFIGIREYDMAKLTGVSHLELYNAHPQCANFGKPWHNAVERKWDYLLSAGRKFYGVASDDTHYLKQWGREFANPGRAWVMVCCEKLDQNAIIEAIRNGDFYASTGVEVEYYRTDPGRMAVKVDLAKTRSNIAQGLGDYSVSRSGKPGCRIDLVTGNGMVLYSVENSALDYAFGDFDTYLRMRIAYCVKTGDEYRTYYAWMQPIMKS